MSEAPREMAHAVWLRFAAKALKAGATITHDVHETTIVEWSVAGVAATRCERPLLHHLRGLRPGRAPTRDYNRVRHRPIADILGIGLLEVRCRSCKPCLLAKSRHWAARCLSEAAVASDVRFFTGTFQPLVLERLKRRAIRAASPDWTALNHGQRAARFTAPATADERASWRLASERKRDRALARAVNFEITLFLARLRKRGVAFRYISVIEKHKSGNPHVHILFFFKEQPSLTKRQVRAEWFSRGIGFDSYQIPKGLRSAPWYICKYVSKSAQHRIRCSRHFGQGPNASTRPKT